LLGKPNNDLMKKFSLIIIAVLLLTACVGKQSDSSFAELQQIAQEERGQTGEYAEDGFDATEFLTTWNFNNLPPEEREEFYKETSLEDGTMLREYKFVAMDTEVEVAPGVFYPSWSYNGQVPGPTIRATEGDTIKINFVNEGSKPHTVHFHGYHSFDMDGSMDAQLVHPGGSFEYEFKAAPFGLHVYHCHSYPVSEHVAKGLYGAYIVDPREDTRPVADQELVMVMNGFDVNFDGANEIYAVNTKAFTYNMDPIQVEAGKLVRIYLVNMLEYDLLNSFHLHANFFDEYETGTKLIPDNFTDTTVMGQGERSVLDVTFREDGLFMFHAHASEFAELGWAGMFQVGGGEVTAEYDTDGV
jgi:manganese oxidase